MSISEKTTVIKSSSSGYDENDLLYKPSFGTRSSNIMSRSMASPLRHSTGGGSTLVRSVEYGYGSSMPGMAMGPGGYGNVSNSGVTTVKTGREREKKDMQDLNERFASYIEKVRFLEAQNRKLGNELDELRSNWGKETSNIKQMYEAEMSEARKLIDDLSKDKAALEIKLSSTQEQFSSLKAQLEEAKKYRQQDREQINKLNQQLADYDSEIHMLRRSVESLETERARDKTTINRLQQEVDNLRMDLNNETLAHLDAENRRQTLEEEMEFMKKVHEQELKELAALAYRDTTAENREFWKSELSQAIRDIQQEYDAKVDQLRGDMEGFYNLKIQEYRTGATKQNMEVTHIREENKKLTKMMSDLRGKLADMEARNAQLEKQYQELVREFDSKDNDHMMECAQLTEEISKLRAEMEGILTELQTLMDAKLSLELEIAAYRKLLEGEESRVDWRTRASLIMYRDAVRPRTQPMREEPTKQPETHFIAKVPSPVREESRDKSPDTDAASSITMSDRESSQKGDDDMGDMKTETVDDNFEGGEVVYQNLGKGEAAVDELLVERSGSGRGSSGDSDHANVDSTKGNILDKAASPIPVTSPEVEHLAFVKAQIKKIEKRNHELDGTDGSNDISPKAETDGQQSPDIVREMAKDSPQIEETTVKTDTSKMILADDINKQDNDSDMTDNKTGSKFAENGIEDENGKTDTTDTKSPTVDIQKHDTHNAIDDKSDIISEHAFEPHIAETIETHTVLQATSDTNESQSTESVKELSTVTNGKESEIGVTTDSKIEPQIDLHVSTIQTEAKSEQHVTDDSKDSQSKDPVVVAHISEAGDNRQEHIDEHVAKSPVLEKTIEAKRDQSVSSDVVGKNEKDIASEHTDLQNDSSGHTNVKNESSDSQDHETYIKTQSQTTAIKGENQNEIVLKTESKTENISKEPISDKFNETNTEKATFDINESQSNETVTKLEDQSMEVKGGQHNETEFKQENKTEHMSKTDTESETQSTKTTSDVMDSQGNETKVKHQYQDIELHPHNETDHSHKIETEQISEFQVIDKQNESKMDKSVLDPKDSDVKETVSIINVEDDRNKKIASQNDALTEHISESSVSKFFINTANESDDNVTESSATLIKLPTDEMRAHVETDKHKSEENSLPHSSHDGDGTGGIPDGIKLEDNASHVAQEKVQSPSETIQHIIEDNQPEESTYPSHKPDIKTTLHDETNSASASTVTEQAKSPIAETYAEKREQRDINQQSSNVIRADVHASDIQHETDIYELEKKQNFESPVIDTRDDPAHQNETTFENGDTKAHRTEIKQVKYDTPDKETVHNETEHPVSKDADIEQVVEKTEDKVLETKVESEIIEQPNTDEDTAEVEASPTKERPDDIKGILTDNEGQLSAQPSNTSTNETVTADTTRSTCVDNANTIDNKGQSTHADSHSISGGSMHKDYPVVITNGNSGESSTNEEPTTASNVESNLQLKNDRAGSLKSKDNSPIEQSHQTLRLEPKGVEGVQHVVQTDKANVIEQRTKGKLNEADSQVIEQSQETAENKTDRTISSPDKINAIELTESNGSVEPKVVETTSKEDQIASENGALLNGHADTILENADTNLDAVDDDAGKVTTDKQAIVQEPTTNGIYDPSEDTVRGGKEQTAGEVKENGLPNTDGDDSQVSMKMMRGEVSAKTTYQRTSTGPIAISEVSPEGKYIMLENTSSGPNRRDVNLDGWKVKRIVDGKRDYLYPFRNFTLKSGKKVKILARGSASEAGLNDLVFRDEDNWGVGAQVNTSLINEKEDEKASHIQKTLYN